jgi:hypothetical protein
VRRRGNRKLEVGSEKLEVRIEEFFNLLPASNFSILTPDF